MDRDEQLSKALTKFKKQYRNSTSGDLQTFILGWEASNDIEIDQSNLDEILNSLGDSAFSMIRSWLFNKANSFSGDETGDIVLFLHGACNSLMPAIEKLEPDYFEENR